MPMTESQDRYARPEVWFLTSELEGERASSFRQTRWCEVFLRAGARVVVMNARGPFGLTIRDFDTEDDFAEFRRDALAVARPQASVRTGFAARALRHVKHALLADLFFPNVRRLVGAGKQRLAGSSGPVAIFASSPPFSLAIAGAQLKRAKADRVHLVVDMRDAWALHASLGGPRIVKRHVERWAFENADCVITVSAGLKNEFDETYGLNTGVMYNVATHYRTPPVPADVDWPALHPDLRPGSVKVVYTGSTPQGFYDVGAFAEALRIARREHGITADQLQFVFVGACEEVQREIARRSVNDAECVFLGHRRNAETRRLQVAADALLFIGYDGPGNSGVVSTKIFEYLALGKPILPIGLYVDSDVDLILRATCDQSLTIRDPGPIALELSTLSHDGLAGLPRLQHPDVMWEYVGAYDRLADDVIRHLMATKQPALPTLRQARFSDV
jgi:glycosyltransferase involved in cell wall biosynthesis